MIANYLIDFGSNSEIQEKNDDLIMRWRQLEEDLEKSTNDCNTLLDKTDSVAISVPKKQQNKVSMTITKCLAKTS